MDVLPDYAAKVTPLREWSHSIPSAVGGGYGGFGWAMNLCLLALWIWAGGRADRPRQRRPGVRGIAGGIDLRPAHELRLNLISTYPLLLLFLRAQRTNRWALLAFGVFDIAGDRRLLLASAARFRTRCFT